MADDYQFTQDWFSWAPPVWTQLIPLLPREPGKRDFLEIGSFEGRSAVWIMENMMSEHDSLMCVDTWEGGEEHDNGEMGGAWERFCHNTALAFERAPNRYYNHFKGESLLYLAQAINEGPEFDFIYIDGSHVAKDVLTDACMAWTLLRPQGIMVFDDYLWGKPRNILHRPKMAIDAFVNLFAEEIDVIHAGYQFIIRKKG
jgi:predicted O-methyltransferase YrrM